MYTHNNDIDDKTANTGLDRHESTTVREGPTRTPPVALGSRPPVGGRLHDAPGHLDYA